MHRAAEEKRFRGCVSCHHTSRADISSVFSRGLQEYSFRFICEIRNRNAPDSTKAEPNFRFQKEAGQWPSASIVHFRPLRPSVPSAPPPVVKLHGEPSVILVGLADRETGSNTLASTVRHQKENSLWRCITNHCHRSQFEFIEGK